MDRKVTMAGIALAGAGALLVVMGLGRFLTTMAGMMQSGPVARLGQGMPGTALPAGHLLLKERPDLR